MYVYTYAGRAHSPEAAQKICFLFGHQFSMLQAPGYRRGVCAIDTEDPLQIFVHQHWGSLAALHAWLDSAEHKNAIAQVIPLLTGGSLATHLYEVLSGGPS